jgi:hypothetical protein
MAPGPLPQDTINGVSKLVRDSLGDAVVHSSWGGPTRKMEVFLSVDDDLADEYRDKLQAALDAGTVTPLGTERPTVGIKVREVRQSVLPICSCGREDIFVP